MVEKEAFNEIRILVYRRLRYIWPQKLTLKSENALFWMATSCLTKYKQILSVVSFACKNLLNFTYLPMNLVTLMNMQGVIT